MMLLLAKPFIRAFVHTQDIPYSILAPLIILFCFIGAYTVRNSLFDIWVMLFFGLLGYFFDRIKFPLAPIILGIVLGPMAEEELRRSLIMSCGEVSIFFTRPISLILLLIAAASFLYALYKSLAKKPKKG
jgi:putative tricarboxylic transport membrane protein